MKYKPLQIGDLTAPIPVIQGGMGVGISLSGLAGAVAKEGAVGILSSAQIGYREPDFAQYPRECNLRAIEKELARARQIAPEGIIGYNIMVALRYYEDYVKAAVKAGADLIISGAGLPVELPALVAGSQTKIAPIVSSAKSAQVILKYWDKKYEKTADLVVVEGPGAGGHLGFQQAQLEQGNFDFDEEIRQICRIVNHYSAQYGIQIPVVVAGAIDTAEEMERVMNLGVQGVQVASRFVTTEECDADIRYKEAYIAARKEDIQIVKSPVGMPGRAIHNAFINRVMKGEKFPPAKCLGCLRNCNPAEIPYCITEALIHAARGELDRALIFCGASAYKATKIETVREVIASLLAE